MQFQTAWEQLDFSAGVGIPLSRSAYIGNTTKVYLTDRDAFKKSVAAAYRDLVPLLDTDMNCLLERDEVDKGDFNMLGHNTTISESEYFDVYRTTQGVPVKDVVEAWYRFRTNTKATEHDTVADILDKVFK